MPSEEIREFLQRMRERAEAERIAAPLPPRSEEIRLYLLKSARRLMSKDGSLNLTCFLFLASGVVVPIVYAGGDEGSDKDGLAEQIRHLTLAFDTECVATVMEAWATDADPKGREEEISSRGIGHFEDKREVLSLMAEWSDTATIWIYGIQRDKKGRFSGFDMRHAYSEAHGVPGFMPGRFSNLVPPAPVPIELRQQMRATLGSQFEKLIAQEESHANKKRGRLN